MLYEVITHWDAANASGITVPVVGPNGETVAELSDSQASYLGVPVEGPYKPDRITSYNVCYTKLLRTG